MRIRVDGQNIREIDTPVAILVLHLGYHDLVGLAGTDATSASLPCQSMHLPLREGRACSNLPFPGTGTDS